MFRRVIAVAIVSLFTLAPLARAEPYMQTLTSTTQNVKVEQWEITSRQVTPECPVNWSVRKIVLHGGKQEGVDVIFVDNGKLQFAVCPTRGMGLLRVDLGDVRLGWDSPVKEIVDPRFINL